MEVSLIYIVEKQCFVLKSAITILDILRHQPRTLRGGLTSMCNAIVRD